MTHPDPAVDKAQRLFTFLARAQQLKTKPVYDVRSYATADRGSVTWLAELPNHPAISIPFLSTPVAEQGAVGADHPDEATTTTVLTVQRVTKPIPPAPPTELIEWLHPSWEQPDDMPRLQETILQPSAPHDHGEAETLAVVQRSTRPDLDDAYRLWLPRWKAWAEQALQTKHLANTYAALFDAYNAVTTNPEELECVLATGLLTWSPNPTTQVHRHLLTAPVVTELDESTGALTVRLDDSAQVLRFEDDMVQPDWYSEPTLPEAMRHACENLTAVPDAVTCHEFGTRFVTRLNAQGRYVADAAKPPRNPSPTVYFAPAIIVRKRSQQGLVHALQGVASIIKTDCEVPSGLMPLIDPDRVPPTTPDRTPGAILEIDHHEIFSPLPLNEVQERILRRVDSHAQTLVQGPPGTGKTHTAAALLSHLLAQGKRVLVTAHTDRALYEVREKLPADIRPLAVSVIGHGRDDFSELQTAVDTISRRMHDHDTDAVERQIQLLLGKVEQAKGERHAFLRQLVAIREKDLTDHHIGAYSGSLVTISRLLADDARRYGWACEFWAGAPGLSSPLTGLEATHLLALLRLDVVRDAPADLAGQLPSPAAVPSPERLLELLTTYRLAHGAQQAHMQGEHHPAFHSISALQAREVERLSDAFTQMQRALRHATGQPAAWVSAAVQAVASDAAFEWQQRHERLTHLCQTVAARLDAMPTGLNITIAGEHGPHARMAQLVLHHISTKGALKVGADGQPKVGLFTPGLIKECGAFFQCVKVRGLPATSAEDLRWVVQHIQAAQELDEMDALWPHGTVIPEEDTLHERLDWHVTQVGYLTTVLNLVEPLHLVSAQVNDLAVPSIAWQDDAQLASYLEAIHAATAHHAVVEAERSFHHELQELHEHAASHDPSSWYARLLAAAFAGDVNAYSEVVSALQEQRNVAEVVQDCRQREGRLAVLSPTLVAALRENPHDSVWDERMKSLDDAVAWTAAKATLHLMETGDPNAIQQQVDAVEVRLRGLAENIAGLRAWNAAMHPSRLSPSSAQALINYSQLVKRLGKGTGRYAAMRRGEIRQAMDRCRPVVPVWIMPLYRVTEQLAMHPDQFDVVLVDEASQAGVEACILQYLAPKIVVIGDDQQVSPSAVGMDQQALRDLAAQYLHDFPDRATWQDPKRSFFDEAISRYSGRLTLVEHRRCVPDIINFSNLIAYQPLNIPLIPVRTASSSPLRAVVPVHVPTGVATGSASSTVNRAEAQALVDQLVACHHDPAYDGMTFGVIALLGTTQAKLLENLLMECLPSDVWASRDLRVGNPPDFQGSERDVMFLSLVAAPDPDKRITALTADNYVQRYNVAFSRAKDQVWLFHSVTAQQITNHEDLRYRLLDYCYGVSTRSAVAHSVAEAVPLDTRVEPFDSLFEQRVYNDIAARGFTVQPQYASMGYRIDMVILSERSKVAIECDGDFWHGPDAYAKDLARQRDLQRCGWTFFRVREVDYYTDRARALQPLWELLDQAGVGAAESGGGAVTAHGYAPVLDVTAPQCASDEGNGSGSEPPQTVVSEPEPMVAPASVAKTLVAQPPAVEVPAGELPRTSGKTTGTDTSSSRNGAGPKLGEILSAVSEEWQGLRAWGFGPRLPDEPVPAPAAKATEPASVHVSAPADPAPASSLLAKYVPFADRLQLLTDLDDGDIAHNLVLVVEAEGPMTQSRLLRSARDACGIGRAGHRFEGAVERGLTFAVRRQAVRFEIPPTLRSSEEAVYFLPGTPSVVVRELGCRDLAEVPLTEIAALLHLVRARSPQMEAADLYRATLREWGLVRLTEGVLQRLALADSIRMAVISTEPPNPR